MSWSSTDPKWQSFNLNIPKLLLGDNKYISKIIDEKEIKVPMPEGNYNSKMQLCRDSWTRSRFPIFNKTMLRVKVDMDKPIPFPGKGTESYNCEEDALYGWSGQASTFEEATGKIVQQVLTYRRIYPL